MGRALTWADPKIIEMAQKNFVPAAADDWYQRRRQDDEGEFFRKVADQGPRKGQGGGTRQGIYVFTAGGLLLGYRNHPDPNVMRQFLLQSLQSWQKLPVKDRAPQAVQVGDAGKVDRQYHRELPKGGVIVNVYTRILDLTADGEFCPGTCKFPGGDRPAHDHLWILADELAALSAAANTEPRFELPAALTQRMLRFHLVDNTRGEPPFWQRGQVHTATIHAVVEKRTGETVTLKLEGRCLLATIADAAKAERGFEASLLGLLELNTATNVLKRFDLVAYGDHWGQGPYTGGARPGRTPLGVAFELSNGTAAADRVPPQAAREWNAYVRADR